MLGSPENFCRHLAGKQERRIRKTTRIVGYLFEITLRKICMPSLPRTTATLISLHFKQTELRNLVSSLLMERLMTLRFAAYEERRGRGDNSLRKGLAILLRFFWNVSAIYPFHAHFLSSEKFGIARSHFVTCLKGNLLHVKMKYHVLRMKKLLVLFSFHVARNKKDGERGNLTVFFYYYH